MMLERQGKIFGAALLGLALAGLAAAADGSAETVPLDIVYGPVAHTREGDIDHREALFISIPADLEGHLFLRLFDPEAAGLHDTAYGSFANSSVLFRLMGGDGAFSGAQLPAAVPDGAPAGDLPPPDETGVPIAEQRFGADEATDDRWVTLAPFEASQGEIRDGRAYFRLDVIGEAGDDGNVFAFEVSRSPDASEPAEDVRLFAFRPTLRWPGTRDAVEIRFDAPAGERVTLQNFDGAAASLELVSTFASLPLSASGQDAWASSSFTVPDGATAIEFRGGNENPNDVTLALFDSAGRPLPFELPARLLPPAVRPVAEGVATPLADCEAVAFDASGSSGQGPLRMEWLFGDGEAADEPVVVHRYAAPGRYEAELRVLEPVDRVASGSALRLLVHVRNRPVAVAGDPVVAAPGEEVLFDGSASIASDRPISSFLWSFGDGSRAKGAEITKAYAAPGLYRSVLRVADDADHPCNFGVAERLVTVNFQPTAEAGEGRDAAVGETLRFDGGASYDIDGEITSWHWTFGDGTEGQGQVVEHAFSAPGTYDVRLAVLDDAGVANSSASDTLRVTVNAPPLPVFAAPERPIAVGEVARFDGTGSSDPDGEILAYEWAFGDGATAEGAVVEYAYATPGTYEVRLTVRDDSATLSDTAETALEVVVSAAPIADAGPDQLVTASEVVLDGGGSSDPDGRITSYEWTFGDGSAGSGRVVRHAYAESGTYEVGLTVRDDSGAPLNVDQDTALVRVNEAPIADAGPDLVAAPGQKLVFDGWGSVDPDGTVEAWLWRFGDGSEAQGRQVGHAFAEPGHYRVELTVRDDTGQDAAFDVDEVLVSVNAPPVANAGPDVLIPPGAKLTLDGTASFDPDGEIEVWRWDFDDLATPVFAAAPKRTFDEPGVYTAQLTVIDASDALNASSSDEVLIHVNHAPVAEAGPEITTDELIVTLDGSGSVDADGDTLIFTWDLGDGSPPLLGQKVSHAYPRGGVFPVTLTVDDGTGLENARAVDATRVIVTSRPVAVAGGNHDVCSGDRILFDASASSDPDGGLLLYEWDFGDGTRAGLVNPAKTYERPGVYPVTLTVRDDSGKPSGVDRDRVVAVVREAPIAVAGPPVLTCTNETIRFDGSRSTDADGAVNLFSWSFGDGSTGGGEKPTHVYERPGEYRVVLTITGDPLGNCSPLDTDETKVTVVEAPRISIDGPARVAVGVPVTYAAQSSQVADAAPPTFEWQLPDGTTAEGPTVTHSFAEPGPYVVALNARFGDGKGSCGAIGTRLEVVANAPPVADAGGPRVVAFGDGLLLDASASTDPDGAITRYEWDFGDGQSATGVEAPHRYAEAGTYTVTLTVTDDAGVANSTTTTTEEITVNPTALAGLEAPGPLCPGESHEWLARTEDGTSASWRFADGTEATGPAVRHAFAQPGVYPVTVTLDDGRGLANSVQTQTVFARVNRRPVAEAGPDRLACPGDTLTFDAGASVDPDGELASFTWRFDDGVVLEGQRVERRFDASGIFAAELTVTDATGTACGVATDKAAVRIDAPPLVDAGPELEGPVGAAHDEFLLDASATRDPDGDGVRIVWDLGDGTRRTGAVIKHRYTAPGNYTVTAEASDTSGLACGVATDTTVVRARARP